MKTKFKFRMIARTCAELAHAQLDSQKDTPLDIDMNREIKFRAWDKEEKKWLNDFQITPCGAIRHHTYSKRNPQGLGWQDINGDKIILMQYTGIKDRNDIEIYEGDIIEVIQIDKDNKKFKNREEVVWVKDMGAWSIMSYIFTHKLLSPQGFKVKIEVVGNIYENPRMKK